MKFVKLTESLFEIQSNHLCNVFIPLISQATKCKILISNFKFKNPVIEVGNLERIFQNNVSQLFTIDLLLIIDI